MPSELKVNKLSPYTGTTLTIGDSGDTISFASGVLPSLESLTVTGDLTVDTDTLYVNSTNDRVGIGTTSPSTTLHLIASGSSGATMPTGTNVFIENNADAKLSIASPDTHSAMVILGSATDQSGSIFQYDHTDLSTTIGSQTINGIVKILSGNGNEAMRIDNGGNVFVATTTNFPGDGNTTTGLMLQDDGTIYSSRASGYAASFNRNSDGTIMSFQSSGTQVGQIGVSATGISMRLGGNATANELDDYEEGTWTPTLALVSVTYTSQSGTYTKIGNQVFITVDITTATLDNTDNSDFTISGIPFNNDGNSCIATINKEVSTIFTNPSIVDSFRIGLASQFRAFQSDGTSFDYNDGTTSGRLLVKIQYTTA